MPPAWRGALISQPVFAPGGVQFARCLPGEGLYLNTDLKDLGITRELPYVFERGRTLRLLDAFEKIKSREGIAVRRGYDYPEMDRIAAAITSYASIQSQRAAGLADDITCFLNQINNGVVNVSWASSFTAGGSISAGTYTAVPGATMNNASAGAISSLLRNPSGTNTKFILTLGMNILASGAQATMYALVDLLVGAGNISANTAVATTIGTPALTRYTTGSGVFAAFNVTTALGATASNLTFSYTNQAGTAGQTSPSVAVTTSLPIGRLLPGGAAAGFMMPLAQGDYGVRAVASATFSAAMGAGVVALDLIHPLALFPALPALMEFERDSFANIDGLTPLATDSGGALGCLTLYEITGQSNTTGNCEFFMRTVEG